MTASKMRTETFTVSPVTKTLNFRPIAALGCARCGRKGYSQHTHSNLYQDGKGTGIKARYLAIFPFSYIRPRILGCYVEHDQSIEMTQEEAEAHTGVCIVDKQRKVGIQR